MKRIIHYIVIKASYINRYIKFERYRKIYGFNKWHMIPKIAKEYVQAIVKYIKKCGVNENTCIVECGCGLCDILSDKSFKSCRLIGVEKELCVLNGAKEICRKKNIEFINGSFEDIKGINIDFLIAVNFTHEISDLDMMRNLKELTEKNEVKNLILDEVTGNYKYEHNYRDIISEIYQVKDVLGPYSSDGGKRYIKIFTKNDYN